jgi:hypothetical protein
VIAPPSAKGGAYQAGHPDPLVVVTADHSHTSQIVAEDSEGEGNPTGYSNNLTTADGRPCGPPARRPRRLLGTNDHTDTFALLQGKAE